MNQARTAALTTALVWSDMLDPMLVKARADSIRARILKNKGNNQTFGLHADIKEKLYQLW